MKNVRIFIKNISPAITDALLQQIGDIELFTYSEQATEADIFILSRPADIEDLDFIPRLYLDPQHKIKLGTLLQDIIRIATHPLQYISKINLKSFIFNPAEKNIIKDGVEINLTDKEAEILYYLSKNINIEVSKEIMLKDIWQYQQGIDTHTLETHIYRLRQKIEVNAENPKILTTKENGYILNV